MLVLTRKQGVSIDISDDIKVIVLDAPDNQQRIGNRCTTESGCPQVRDL